MTLRVSVAIATAQRQEVIELEVPEGASVAVALAACRLPERFPGIDLAAMTVGIWSKACTRDTPLKDGDRVEIYRALPADPRQMRRSRAALKPSNRSRNGP